MITIMKKTRNRKIYIHLIGRGNDRLDTKANAAINMAFGGMPVYTLGT